MISKEEVKLFLNQFYTKLNVFGILFLDARQKNIQTLLNLEISQLERLNIIKSITIDDYSEGPITDTLNNFKEMWVFGKDVKGHEVYIKICMGVPNSKTICISFHEAEHRMKYPFKQK